MNNRNRLIILIIGLVFLGFIAWYFSHIIFYILASAVLSIMGHPLVRLFDRIRYRRFAIPHFLSAILALITMVSIIAVLLRLFIPIVISQVASLSEIEPTLLSQAFMDPLEPLEIFLMQQGMIESDLATFIEGSVTGILDRIEFTEILNKALNLTGSLFIAGFSILFLTFFFLKDEHLFARGVLAMVPDKYVEDTKKMMVDIKYLLTRYFIGIMLEVFIMMTLITVGVSILGFENAMLIGFLGGMMNVVPYLGPLIGATVGAIIGMATNFDPGNPEGMLWVALGVIGVFSAANLIDNIVLQPAIYSNSVKAHPIEIFVVILMAASIAGIPGMILAIPSYTVARVFARQFFSQFKIVSSLTKNM